MRRRLLAATTTFALIASPAAAFAQDEAAPTDPVEDSTSLEDLSQALEEWADGMVGDLETVLADLMAGFVFSRMEADALAEMEELADAADEPEEGEEADEAERTRTTAPMARPSPPWPTAPRAAASAPWSRAWPTTAST